MMWRQRAGEFRRGFERFASDDSEIALMTVASLFDGGDGGGYRAVVCHDIDVNDRLGYHADDARASDMLNTQDVCETRPKIVFDLPEPMWPRRIVFA